VTRVTIIEPRHTQSVITARVSEERGKSLKRDRFVNTAGRVFTRLPIDVSNFYSSCTALIAAGPIYNRVIALGAIEMSRLLTMVREIREDVM